jgi:hypothetical protein
MGAATAHGSAAQRGARMALCLALLTMETPTVAKMATRRAVLTAMQMAARMDMRSV